MATPNHNQGAQGRLQAAHHTPEGALVHPEPAGEANVGSRCKGLIPYIYIIQPYISL